MSAFDQAVSASEKIGTASLPLPTPTIGVFDSGFGGLTVLRALEALMPAARYVYLGDTARLPYGSKSRETVARYAVSSARFLREQGAEAVVIACNTASALALDEVTTELPVPVIGVIAPGAGAAAKTDGDVIVLATAATVHSGAYTRALAALGVKATEKACPLLVPLVEEGWIEHPITDQVAEIYLREALLEAPEAKTLLLGCTHYPLLRGVLERACDRLGRPLRIVDSAEVTAEAVRERMGIAREAATGDIAPESTFYATDSVEKFERLGSRFLGRPLPEVRLLDLGG